MGCITVIFEIIFLMIKASFFIFIFIVALLGVIITTIVKKIIEQSKKKKYQSDNILYNEKTIEENSHNIKIQNTTKKSVANLSHLKIYISKKYKNIDKNDELNYKLLGLESINTPIVYYDEYAENKDYHVFEADEYSSEQYGDLLYKIYIHCSNDFYATIGYEQDKVDYTITPKDNQIYINDNNHKFIENKYTYLKNKITNFSDKLYEYFTYIEDENFYYDVVPNDDLDCDSIEMLSDKLNQTDDILIFELPYMEEICTIIDIIEPKILKEYQKGQKQVFESLPEIEEIDDEESIILSNKKIKKQEMTWEEKEFEEQADLWGLSEEDRRIAKEERMTPAEFVEAEEYDDDELLLDEWER